MKNRSFSSVQSRLFASCILAVSAVHLVACERIIHPSLEPLSAYQIKPSAVIMDGLHARFFGATTIQVDDGETSIMMDGFFSRPGLAQLIFMKIEPNEARIIPVLNKVPKPAAVLVAHSHYDHAMDAAVVAQRTGAVLYGTNSTANIGNGYTKLPSEQIQIPKHGEVRYFRRFSVQFLESPHSPDFWFPGEITDHLKSPVPVSAYREGRNFSFVLRHQLGTILIHPSANYSPCLFKDVKADVVFLSIGMLGKQSEAFRREYWQQVVRATGAKLVIPIHWDDLTRPLDKPLLPMPYLVDDFNTAMEFVLGMAKADGIHVRFMPLFEPIHVMDTIKELSELHRAGHPGILEKP
nr:MBL fold metallo-hydrolase [Nitrosomonas nitrosa]